MNGENSGGPVIVASLLLSISIVGAGYLLARSIDRGAQKLDGLAAAFDSLPTAAAPKAAAPARRKRPEVGTRYEIELAGAPIRGEAAAAVTIVEWGDFQ